MKEKRAKRKNRKIVHFILLLVIVSLTACAFTVYSAAAGKICITSAKRPLNQYDGTIETVTSSNDSDGDGIDDQTDLLLSALEYVQTKPKYRSAYYGTGYPDDGYGVCTDVIAFAFQGAGMDLMELVHEDIINNPDGYDSDVGDKNIDFRRVRNLRVYLNHTALVLTADLNDISQWQGGDIVIFKDHIGIVSDRRNEKGIPYIIHHGSPMQWNYEEDILGKRNDLTGHYRVY